MTAGQDSSKQLLSSTEILMKDGGTSWKPAAKLPYKARFLRGVSLDNGLFLVTGGENLFSQGFFELPQYLA